MKQPFPEPVRMQLVILAAACALGFSNEAAGRDALGGEKAAAPAGARSAAELLEKEDPVVLAIRESHPTTAVQLTRAMQAMMDYGRYDEAKKYLAQLLETHPKDDVLVEVHRQFGSALFFRLLQDEQLAPEGAQLARATMAAAAKAARDPRHLEALVRDLSDRSLGVRTAALRGLAGAGPSAITPMVRALADRSRHDEHAAVRDALVQLGDGAIEPLLGVLDSPDELLLAEVINVLGRLEAMRALPYLIRPFGSAKSSPALRRAAGQALLRLVGATPDRHEAQRFLYRRALALYAGKLPRKPDHEEKIELWHWDAANRATVPRRYTARAASRVVAARLAADLYQLDPANEDYRRLYLSASLEAAKLTHGVNRPLPKGPAYSAAAGAGATALENVLAEAMAGGHVAAAIAAAEVLGQIGDPQLLRSDDGQPRTLALALRHGDRRLRFAAARAILTIDPPRPFPGSSWLLEVLGYLVRTAGERRVLIGHPRTEPARSLVGSLASGGIQADTATTGHQFFRLAAANPDYDFLLLSDAVDYPDYRELLQMLRRDPRTAQLPVGLMTSTEKLGQMKRFAELDPLTDAFPWPYEESALWFAAGRLVALAGAGRVAPEEKIDQAGAALDAMLRIAQQPDRYPFYDLLGQQDAIISALGTPEVSLKAARLLGQIGSPRAQRALVELASQNARPLAERQAAARAFAAAVGRRGTLLTTPQIRRQYDRYNQSEHLDRETQAVLGSILDVIEAKRNREDEARRSGNQPE